jgi:hypothetical protein
LPPILLKTVFYFAAVGVTTFVSSDFRPKAFQDAELFSQPWFLYLFEIP